VTEYEAAMLAHMRSEHADILKDIRESTKFEDDVKTRTVAALDAFAKQFA
jgi:F-type H+-transporting ATPase subunit alpha